MKSSFEYWQMWVFVLLALAGGFILGADWVFAGFLGGGLIGFAVSMAFDLGRKEAFNYIEREFGGEKT